MRATSCSHSLGHNNFFVPRCVQYKVQRIMSLTTPLIEIPSEALHLHNGDQPNNSVAFILSSSCSRPELRYLIPQQTHFLKGLDYSLIEWHRDPRFAVENKIFVEWMHTGMKEWMRERMNKERKATKGLIAWCQRKSEREHFSSVFIFLISTAMTWSTLIKSSTIPNEQFNKTNQPYILTSQKVKWFNNRLP